MKGSNIKKKKKFDDFESMLLQKLLEPSWHKQWFLGPTSTNPLQNSENTNSDNKFWITEMEIP